MLLVFACINLAITEFQYVVLIFFFFLLKRCCTVSTMNFVMMNYYLYIIQVMY